MDIQRSLLSLALSGLIISTTGCNSEHEKKPQNTNTVSTSHEASDEISATTQTETTIKNQYIIVLKPNSDLPESAAQVIAKQYNGKVLHIYNHAIRGFSIQIPEQASDKFLEAIQKNPQVNYIEQDTVIKLNTQTQSNATWGLDRIDQKLLPLNGSYTYQTTADSITAYIIDSGILHTHKEFTGRIVSGYSVINDGNGTEDCNGHGTHVSGTVGGSTYGVAKSVLLAPVRVLDCNGSGTMSGVIAGIDWIIKNGQKPAIVNMSIGGNANSTLDSAVENLFNNGYTPIVAAGNSSEDACNYSPARAGNAITVAATESNDYRASYSNYGSCVDIFSPGSKIKSAWIGSSTATATASGTSMASPHTSGVIALLLKQNPNATPKELTTILIQQSTLDIVSDPKASPNRLVFSLVEKEGDTSTPEGNTTVHVDSLSATTTIFRNSSWKAHVTTTVVDTEGKVVVGASVIGSFSNGGSSLNCTTNNIGQCVIDSGNIPRTVNETTFAVDKIQGDNITYQASSNTISSITIAR